MYHDELVDYVIEHSSEASRYEMVAEECAELLHCAQKIARYLRGEQPVAEDFDPEKEKIHMLEEYADVILSLQSVGLNDFTKARDKTMMNFYESKAVRWAQRLKKKEESAKNTVYFTEPKGY